MLILKYKKSKKVKNIKNIEIQKHIKIYKYNYKIINILIVIVIYCSLFVFLKNEKKTNRPENIKH